MEKKYILNAVPSLTWNWLKSNNDTLNFDDSIQFSGTQAEFSNLPKGIELSKDGPVTGLPFSTSAVFNIPNPKFGDTARTAQNARITTGAKETNEDFEKFISSVEKLQNFVINGKTSEPLILNLTADNNIVATQTIHAMENSEATIIFVYQNTNKDAASTEIIKTKIFAEANSKLHIIKIQLLNSSALQLDDTQIVAGENALVKFTQLELGGSHVISGLHTNLCEYQAKFISNVAYLCKDSQILDMNHIVYHYGKKTECEMHVNGTLKDNSAKTYRGTIDFKNGCCGSKGNEMEETLLLSPKAVNKSLPVILCDEEDVEGEHGATIGRLSSDILFYMQSRGIDEKQAEQIMSKAKIQAAADLIPDEKIKELINDFIGDLQ